MRGYIYDNGFFVFADGATVNANVVRTLIRSPDDKHFSVRYIPEGADIFSAMTPAEERSYRPMWDNEYDAPTGPTDEPDEDNLRNLSAEADKAYYAGFAANSPSVTVKYNPETGLWDRPIEIKAGERVTITAVPEYTASMDAVSLGIMVTPPPKQPIRYPKSFDELCGLMDHEASDEILGVQPDPVSLVVPQGIPKGAARSWISNNALMDMMIERGLIALTEN